MMDTRTDSPQPKDRGSEALAQALSVSFRVLRYVLLLLILAYALTGFFDVEQYERAMVLRFGALPEGPDRIVGPGFHITLPKPFAEVVTVPTERTFTVATETFWADSLDPVDPLSPDSMQPQYAGELFGYTLTGDANILHSRWALRYTIPDPETYAFGFQDIPSVLHVELDRAILKTSCRLSIDQALRTDIETYRAEVEVELENRVDALGLGVNVLGVDLIVEAPPQEVALAFAAVVGSENERSQRILGARAEASRTVNEGRGKAAGVILEAEAYAKRTVDEVSADADYFQKILVKYQENQHMLLTTLLQDTLRRTLKNAPEKFIIRNNDAGEIRITIGRKQRRPGDSK